jgi:predicted NBD/HSP70 family sugar kinase
MRIVQNSNNITRVLKEIKLKPGISRIEIAKIIGLDKSTVTVVLNRLMEFGLVEETSESLTPYSGGRKPIGIKIKSKTGIILGIEIQTNYYMATVIDLTGSIIKTMQGEVFETKNFFYTFLDVYKEIYAEIESFAIPLLGIGVSTSGIINPHTGIITDSNPLCIHEPEDFYEEIKAFIHVPVFIDNDANCGCWAELSAFERLRSQDFLFVLGEFRKDTIGKNSEYILGIGFGIVIGERVHYGRNYSAGEYQSTSWKAPNKSQFSLSDKELIQLKSDEEIVERIKSELAKDIAFLTNILNLSKVIIGGGLSEHLGILKPEIEKAIEYNWSYESKPDVQIQPAPFKNNIVAYGAAAMLIEQLFVAFETSSENPWKPKIGIDLFNDFAERIKASNSKKHVG